MDSTCKAGFPQKTAPWTYLELEEKFNKANQMYLKIKMHVRRGPESSETNQYNIMQALCCRCNTDMRIIPDETSLYLYLMKYVVKPEKMSKSLAETIREACKNTNSVVSGKASTFTRKLSIYFYSKSFLFKFFF